MNTTEPRDLVGQTVRAIEALEKVIGESNTPGLYTQEKESLEDWTARNRRKSAILARNIVLRNVPDYEDRYGING